MVTVYQPKGIGHIKYIHNQALRLWQENYECAEAGWDQSLLDAMEIHREYLITGIKMTKQELNYRKANKRVKRAGIWLRNGSTGVWENISEQCS